MTWFAPLAIETRIGAPSSVKTIVFVAAVALAGSSGVSHAQTEPALQEQPAPGAGTTPDGLRDLAAMTFSCPQAALNAAAREAAEVPSQGTYQFSYFRIISDSHDASYEIHFESNYEGEEILKYCVSIYCQQGWDPETTKATVTLISDEDQPVAVTAHGADCGEQHVPAQRRSAQ